MVSIFQGLQIYRGSKFPFCHWLCWSSLQQCCRYHSVPACEWEDNIKQWATDDDVVLVVEWTQRTRGVWWRIVGRRYEWQSVILNTQHQTLDVFNHDPVIFLRTATQQVLTLDHTQRIVSMIPSRHALTLYRGSS